MSKCKRCNIEVLDDSISCPLCNGVLELDKDLKEDEIFQSKSIMYPDVAPLTRKMRFVIKLVIFCSIVIEALLIIINYFTYNKVKWSAICGVGLLYGCVTLIHSFQTNASNRNKLMVQTIFIILTSVFLDLAIGYIGWAVDFAIPCTMILLDCAIIVLMILDTYDWQSYIMLQVFSFVLCLVMTILLLFTDIFHHPLLMLIADGTTLLLLIGTLLFGDKRATTELKRRFHV